MSKRLLVGAGVILAIGTLVAPNVAEAKSSCSVSSYRTQTDSGHRSDQVRCLQQTLNAQGINSGPVDGWFGPITRGAVVAYQTAHRLTVDGEVGRQTAGSLGIWDASVRQIAASSTRSTTRHRTTRHSTFSGSTGRSGVNWDSVARCESGGQWSHGLVTNHVGTFGGGLMIMQSAWRQYGGGQFASTPGGASRAEQIIVAERIAARVGAARAWQCPVG